jgi:D-alanyl-D-alanine carboxypeptidase (penicillin-binding protein 5/6)
MAARGTRLAGLALGGGALVLSSVAAAAPAVAEPGAAAAPPAKVRTETVGGDLLGVPGVHVDPIDGAGAKPVPTSVAASWTLSDADTGEVLAAKNAHLRRLPASTLKTLTAVTLLEKLDPAQVYTATWDDAVAEGSRVGIVPGGTYTVDQLWRALFLSSGNDAARSLAMVNGGMKKTVAEMNAKAAELGALDTVARNTSGLDHDEQLSSAYDLALIARAGLAIPEFREYTTMISTKFPGAKAKAGKKRETFMVYNGNPLLRQQYRGAIGVKTGYTDAAGRTFIGAAERGGRTLVVTLMGYNTDTHDEAAKFLDWGFANAEKVEPVGRLVEPGELDSGDGEGDGDEAAPAAASVGGSGGGTPAWPFVLVGTPLALIALFAAVGSRRPARSPLEAANRGRGGRRSRDGARRSSYSSSNRSRY